MEDETTFVEQLLNSDIFEPNMPNKNERLQGYLERLGKFKSRKMRLEQVISEHEVHLGSILERNEEDALKSSFLHRQDDLEMEVLSCTDDFKNVKAEIFNFVGETLKKRMENTK